MLDLGTVRPGSTIRIPFSTFDKDDGSAITMTNFAAADILIYKDGNTTERASTSGFTATTDFDSKTGKHIAVIDLADNTTSGFYNSGSEYLVAIDSVTVDGVTVGAWVARFRIGYPNAVLDTTIATLSSQTSFTLTVGPAEDDAINGHWVIIHDIASAVQMGKALVLDYTGSTKTVTLAAGTTFTAAAGDNISVMDLAPLQPTTMGRTLDVSTGGEAGVDWANVGSPTTSLALTGTTIAVTQKVDVDTIKTNPVVNGGTITFPSGATLASTTNITAGTITTATNVTTVNGLAAGIITASSIASDAITAAKIADGAIDAATFAAGAINAAAIASDAITDAKVASDVTIASVTGAVGSVTGNVGGNVAGSVGSVTAAVTVTGDCATAGTRLLTAIELDGSVYRFTTNALEQAPSGGGGSTDWTSDERTVIRSILGIPASGTTPDDPTVGVLDTIRGKTSQLTFTVSNQLDVNMLSQAGATVYTKDFTLAAYSANVITLPSLMADGSTAIPDSDQYEYCILSVVGGTGRGQSIETTTAAVGARQYNIVAPTFTPDNTTQCIVTQYLRLAPIKTNWFTATGLATDAVTEIVGGVLNAVATDYDTAGTIGEAIGSGGGGGGATASEIADAVWDEVLSGHLTAGSTGNALNAAGSAGDPWATTLPGAYSGTQAGFVFGTFRAATLDVRSPSIDADFSMELIIGDDYHASDSDNLQFTIGASPSLSGATVTFQIQNDVSLPFDDANAVEATASVSGTNPQLILVNIAGTLTEDLSEGWHACRVKAVLSSGRVKTLRRGRANLLQRGDDAP